MKAVDFELRYKTWGKLAKDVQEQLRMFGLLLRTDVCLDQFSSIAIRLISPSSQSFELHGEVIQVIANQGLAVSLPQSKNQQALSDLSLLCAANPATESETTLEFDPRVRHKSQQPETAQKKIEEMSVGEKRSAALHGKRDVRWLLIKDRNKTIHPFVIKNPAITLDEIEQISKMPSVNPEVLRMIAANRDWTRSTTICRNLVRNPKTPMREALRLLNKLPKNELRALAKSNNVRTAVQQAARKKVL